MDFRKEDRSKLLKVILAVSLTVNIFVAGWFAGSFVTREVSPVSEPLFANRPPPPPGFGGPPGGPGRFMPREILHALHQLSPEGQQLMIDALRAQRLLRPPFEMPELIEQHEKLGQIIAAEEFDEEAFDREVAIIREKVQERILLTFDVINEAFKQLSPEDKRAFHEWRSRTLRRGEFKPPLFE